MKSKSDKSLSHGMRELRHQAEALVVEDQTFEGESVADKRLLHELQVHQIELVMQNKQLRQIQVALEESRDRYVNLYDFSPVGYLTIDTQGMIVEANFKAALLLGVPRAEVLEHFFSKFLIDDDKDQWYRAFNRIKSLEPDESISLDLQLNHGDSDDFYVRLICLRMPENSQQHIMRMTMMDVTKEINAERERLAYELKLRNSLVREVHHRVKNNLQGVIGLMNLHEVNHPELHEGITEAISKIESIATTHGLRGANVDALLMLVDVLREIATNNQVLLNTPISINIPAQLQAWKLKEEESVPIALIINELLLNAIKHSPKNTMITLSVEEKSASNGVQIMVTSIGKFSDVDEQTQQPKKGVGLTLVDSLMPKTGATLSWQQVGGLVSAYLTLTSPVIHF